MTNFEVKCDECGAVGFGKCTCLTRQQLKAENEKQKQDIKSLVEALVATTRYMHPDVGYGQFLANNNLIADINKRY